MSSHKRLLALLAQILVVAPALAANVSVVVTGTFSSHEDSSGILPYEEPLSGTEFQLAFTYDDATPDSVSSGTIDIVPYLGIYSSGASSAVLTMGSQSFEMLDENEILIVTEATNTATGADSNLWQFKTYTETPTGVPGEVVVSSFGLVLTSAFPTWPSPLESDDLIEPVLAEWGSGSLFYRVSRENEFDDSSEVLAQSYATVTGISIVPIPPAVWLFGSALAGLCWIRRRPLGR